MEISKPKGFLENDTKKDQKPCGKKGLGKKIPLESGGKRNKVWFCKHEQPEFYQRMEVVETFNQPDEQHLQFVPAGTSVEVELCFPQNPVTCWQVEVVLMGQKRDIWNGQTRTLSPVLTRKNPIWNVSPGLTRDVSNRLSCRWMWTGSE